MLLVNNNEDNFGEIIEIKSLDWVKLNRLDNKSHRKFNL